MNDPVGAALMLGAGLCFMAASYTVCYAIWLRGWEGWESWHARTGLNEEEAVATRLQRLRDEAEGK